jgi:P27 family predicted phage terminase small subunit
MKPGPRPTPTSILKLRGSWRGKDRPDADLEPNMPKMPSWLSAAAKAEWKRRIPELNALGVLQKVDVTILAMYCTDFAEWEAAYEECEKLSTRFISMDREVDEKGVVLKSGRVKKHPIDYAYSYSMKTSHVLMNF